LPLQRSWGGPQQLFNIPRIPAFDFPRKPSSASRQRRRNPQRRLRVILLIYFQ
jgi:hypothetical protein